MTNFKPNVSLHVYRTDSFDDGLFAPICLLIDVLRFTSTVIAALDAGLKQVIPLSEINEALGLDYDYLAAEKNAMQLANTDLTNSPSAMRELKKNTTLALCSTNGSRCLNALPTMSTVLLAGLVNRSAVANVATKLAVARSLPISIVLAGRKGVAEDDDLMVAKALLDVIPHQSVTYHNLDGERMNALDYHALAKTDTASRIDALGHHEDVVYSGEVDVTEMVPAFDAKNSIIIPYEED